MINNRQKRKNRENGGCATDIGNCAEVNQDRILLRTFRKEEKAPSITLGIVCDGVGGLEHGEIASERIVSMAEEWFENLTAWVDPAAAEPALLFSHFKDAAEEWNESLFDFCRGQGIRTGTTMSAVLAVRECFYLVHVGDSRIYRYRETVGQLEQLTEDDSVAKMKNGRMKNYLSRYVGQQPDFLYHTLQGKLKEGDLLIFCTDGAYSLLQDNDIRLLQDNIILKKDNGKKKENADCSVLCADLLQELKQRGGTDNLSLGVLWAEPL